MERKRSITVLVGGCAALRLTLHTTVALRAQGIELAGGTDSYARLLAAMTAAPIDLLVLDRDLPGLGDVEPDPLGIVDIVAAIETPGRFAAGSKRSRGS